MFSSASNAADADVIDRHAEKYVVRLAESECDVRRAQALRFAVFNVELDEGLIDAELTGLDADKFDAVCDHLLVVSARSSEVVGTYRLQTGSRAAENLGYYSEREFDFTPFERIRGELLELGRACIHRDHRNFTVLNALWKGIATYARKRGSRYLIGCSSLTSQDERIGAAMYSKLNLHLAPAPFRTQPRAEFACDLSDASRAAPKTPKLLAAYLALGAQVCAPPAIDRDFKTIDFLTLFDLDLLRLKLASAHRFAGKTSTN
jgi:putative hemolysin